MVQILPQKTNLGSQIGQSLGQGIQSGMQQGFQRGMLQQALGKAKGLAEQKFDAEGKPLPNDPMALAFGLMEAGAGIPGSERYLSTLLPMLLSQARAQNIYGPAGAQSDQGGLQGQPGSGIQDLGADGMPKGGSRLGPMNPAKAYQEALKFVEGNEPSGYLKLPMTPQQQQDYAQRVALLRGDPQAYQEGLQEARNINNARSEARNTISAEADALGIPPEEKQRFMQYATEAQHLNDPTAIVRYAADKTMQLRNQKESLKNIEAPGVLQKLGGITPMHWIPGATIYNALTNKGTARRNALKGYQQIVRNVVKEGEEPFARQTLAEKGLSPSEIEELIHPLSDAKVKEMNRLPKGNQLDPSVRKSKLVDFLRTNLDNNTSLSVLRNYLVEDRNYDWQEVLDAIQTAFPDGENLTKYQAAEIPNIAKPPIQSLSQIFGSQPNITGFLRGQK